jgi:serine/threonine-protein kinase
MGTFPKKTILIVIASVAGFLFLAALFWFLLFKGQFSEYQDAQYKFAIKYPSSWRIIVHPQANVAVVFIRPKDTALDTIQENFNVTVQPAPKDILTISEFSAAIKRQMTGTFGKSIKIVEDKPLQWGWRQGHEMVFEAPQPDHIKMVNAWVLRGDQAYILTFLGDMNKYGKDGIVVDEMVHSLELQ